MHGELGLQPYGWSLTFGWLRGERRGGGGEEGPGRITQQLLNKSTADQGQLQLHTYAGTQRTAPVLLDLPLDRSILSLATFAV